MACPAAAAAALGVWSSEPSLAISWASRNIGFWISQTTWLKVKLKIVNFLLSPQSWLWKFLRTCTPLRMCMHAPFKLL